jgi:hypothetical protein
MLSEPPRYIIKRGVSQPEPEHITGGNWPCSNLKLGAPVQVGVPRSRFKFPGPSGFGGPGLTSSLRLSSSSS